MYLLVLSLFFLFALCAPQWDEPNLARPSAHNATGLNINGHGANSSSGGFGGTVISMLLEYDVPRKLQGRQQKKCVVPGDIICPLQNGCCPPSDNCQPTFCCPKIAITCGKPTTVCCETGGVCCNRSPTGCCAPGGNCCNAKYPVPCCGPGESCNVLGCCPSTAQKCDGATCCAAGSVCCPGSSTGCCVAGAVCCGGECCAPGSTCNDGICGSAMPTLTFPYQKGHNDELIKNICKGMGGSNSDTLTYSGPMSSQAKRLKRNAQGCTDGLCDTKNTGLSCDEYPFASTDEGGGNRASGVVLCLPEHQNNWQGHLMRAWTNSLKRTGFSAGQKYKVQVTGVDCSKFKRDTITTTGLGSSLWPPFEFDTMNQSFITVSLGDIPPGTYSVDIHLTSGSVSSVYLVDNEGEDLANVTSVPLAGKPLQISFTLEYGAVGAGIGLFTTETTTNVSYTVVETPVASNTAPNSAIRTTSLKSTSFSLFILPSIMFAAMFAGALLM